MGQIRLNSKDSALKVTIDPEHGGMVTQITIAGREVLHIDTGLLQTAPMPAGGMPVLFPFASKTADDRYTVNGKTYSMPMHGLVKNSAFAVESADEQCTVLWIDNSGAGKAQNYPFDFKLTIEYRVEENRLLAVTRVRNDSDTRMPHAMGLHPFFKAEDKSRLHLEHNMKQMYDYERREDCALPDTADLAAFWDHVFFLDEEDPCGAFTLTNDELGYRVECRADRAYRTLVLCSHLEGSMCVEPWCGIPDSANNGRFLQWIEPGEEAEYVTEFVFEAV